MNKVFINALKNRKSDGFIPVIPDIKRYSPKEGELFRGRDPAEIALRLKSAGAPALSVVTEKTHFKGSLTLLKEIVQKSGLPVLQKDFIKNAEQLKVAKECGAFAVLIICATLSRKQAESLYKSALDLELSPLLEVHTEEEMSFAAEIGAKLIGINNRDILKLELDTGGISLTEKLAKKAPRDAFIISESSIKTAKEAHTAISFGADAILVGTALWQAENIEKLYREMSNR